MLAAASATPESVFNVVRNGNHALVFNTKGAPYNKLRTAIMRCNILRFLASPQSFGTFNSIIRVWL